MRTDVTDLLVAWGSGDSGARDLLMPLVYADLRYLARSVMRSERSNHTLQPTALVNEAYCRLVRQDRAGWQHRAQFMAVAARVMRRILVDYGRKRRAKKRVAVTVNSKGWESERDSRLDALVLEEALTKLEKVAPRQSKVVELRFYGGLANKEVAHVLGVSPRTVRLDWAAARTWLYRELEKTS